MPAEVVMHWFTPEVEYWLWWGWLVALVLVGAYTLHRGLLRKVAATHAYEVALSISPFVVLTAFAMLCAAKPYWWLLLPFLFLSPLTAAAAFQLQMQRDNPSKRELDAAFVGLVTLVLVIVIYVALLNV